MTKTMNMRGGVEPEMRAVVLVGDGEELGAFGRLLGARERATVEVRPDAQRTALRPIARLVVEPADHDPTVRVSGDTATLAASPESLHWLAADVAEFLEFDTSEPGIHTHLVERPSSGEGEGYYELVLSGPVLDDDA